MDNNKFSNYRDDFKNKENIALNSFAPNIKEKKGLEQYFLSKETIEIFANLILNKYQNKEEIERKVCLICIPTLAKYFYEKYQINITILDIDKRFEYLPGFIYYDINYPKKLENDFEFFLSDPPFFAFSIQQFSKIFSILVNDIEKSYIIFSWWIRLDKELYREFWKYNIKLNISKFEIKYSTLSGEKENNICIFTNKEVGPIYFRDNKKKNKKKIKNKNDAINKMIRKK